MSNDRTKTNENVYFKARKEAAVYNDTLNSRAGAADVIGVSESSLTDYELGLTKIVPVDKVVLMAEFYNAPWLKTNYCKTECPIGKCLPIPVEQTGIEKIALRLLHALEVGKIAEVRADVLRIGVDGKIDDNEICDLREIMEHLNSLERAIIELRNYCEMASKACHEEGTNG